MIEPAPATHPDPAAVTAASFATMSGTCQYATGPVIPCAPPLGTRPMC